MTAVAATSDTISANLAASKSTIASTEQTFLTLLTTQLKNQDPTSPMDTAQFTSQVTQMTGVEQQLLSNDLLQQLVGANSALSSAVSVIGKAVSSEQTTGTLSNGKLDFDYNLAGTAANVKLEVVNAAGTTVATINPTDNKAGDHTFTWDGKSDITGKTLPDGGTYALKVTATDTTGAAIGASANALVTGVASAVGAQNGQTMVNVGGVLVPYSSIVNVTSAAAS